MFTRPHASTHTWRDFFIHIATIVVGLIIAVGLEQLVERIHQHYELRETREALASELEANRDHLKLDEHDWLRTTARLKNNLLVLQYIRQHPGTPETALPGDLVWNQSPFLYDHAVWDAAEKNGVTRNACPSPKPTPIRISTPSSPASASRITITGTPSTTPTASISSILTPPISRRSASIRSSSSPRPPSKKILSSVIPMAASPVISPTFPMPLPGTISGVFAPPRSISIPQGMAAAHQRTTDRVNAGLHALDPSTP